LRDGLIVKREWQFDGSDAELNEVVVLTNVEGTTEFAYRKLLRENGRHSGGLIQWMDFNQS
jgi:hypothetical protein